MVLSLLKDEVEVTLAQASPVIRWRPRSFLILFKRQSVVLDRLLEVSSFVLAGSTCVSGIYVIRVQLKHTIVVSYRFINPTLLLVGAPTNVVGPSILRVQLHQVVTVLDSFLEHALLEVAGTADEQSLFVRIIILQFLRTN